MKNIAVILAAGSSKRFGKNPKLLSSIYGKTIFEYSVDAFEKNKAIDSIVIVTNPTLLKKFQAIATEREWKKINRFLIGGKERYESSLVAVRTFICEKDCNLIFHDAARPLVSQRIIDDVVESLKTHSAVDTAIPLTDSLVIVNEAKLITEVPDRSKYYRSQTPQAFNIKVIEKAFKAAIADKNFTASDDCGVVKNYLKNENIYIVAGEERNIKITYLEDLNYCEFLLAKGE